MAETDAKLMARALELAKGGDPSPKPHVGAVIARGITTLAEAFYQESDSPHPALAALQAAGAKARGASLYLSLEPGDPKDDEASIAQAIQSAGIRRVLVGCLNPDPNKQGVELERLKEAGVTVEVGVLEDDAQFLIKPWRKFITQSTAYLALKLGVSLDGRIASKSGASKWITCPQSRARVHALRSHYDAVMVGVNTIIADDPELTVREVAGRDPIRIVVDSTLRIPTDRQVVVTANDTPTCVITTNDASEAVSETLVASGVSVIRVPPTTEGRCDMVAALKALAAREVVSILCEGGAELAGSLLAGRMPDELHMFVAPIMLGPRGRPWAVDWAGPDNPNLAPRIEPPNWELCGTDAYLSGPIVYPRKKAAAPASG